MVDLMLCDDAGNELEDKKQDGKETVYGAAQNDHKILASTPLSWNDGVALHCQDGELLNLVQGGERDGRRLWHLPHRNGKYRKRKEKERLDHAIGGEGTLEYVLTKNGQPVSSNVKVKLHRWQTVFTDQQYRTMLEDIGALAFSSLSSVVHSDMTKAVANEKGAADHGFEMRRIRGAQTFVESVIEFGELVLRHIKDIETAPLRSMQRSPMPVRVPSARPTAREHQMLDQNPAARTLWLPRLQESLDCTENRFIKYVLHTVMDGLILSARRQLCAVGDDRDSGEQRTASAIAEVDLRLEQKAEEYDRQRSVQRKALFKLKDRLQSMKEGIKCARRREFWRALPSPDMQPELTNRLYGTNGYAQIVRAYDHLSGSLDDKLQRIMRLLHAIDSDGIRATWQLYEIWVFAQLYSAFLSHVGGAMPDGDTFFEFLELHDGELRLRENTPLVIKIDNKCATNGTLVKLSYQVRHRSLDGKCLVPDIQLTVHPIGRPPIMMIFDAKLRSYRFPSKQFFSDVREVAYKKYYKNLSINKNFRLFSYIVHSSGNPEFNNLGEALIDKRGLAEDKNRELSSELPKYRYGSLCLTPGLARENDVQFTRLVRLVFTYHFGTLFDGCCFECGVPLRPIASDMTNGDVYECSSCAEFWLITHCQNSKQHRLVKFRNRNIHLLRKKNADELMFVCPTCGDRGPGG